MWEVYTSLRLSQHYGWENWKVCALPTRMHRFAKPHQCLLHPANPFHPVDTRDPTQVGLYLCGLLSTVLPMTQIDLAARMSDQACPPRPLYARPLHARTLDSLSHLGIPSSFTRCHQQVGMKVFAALPIVGYLLCFGYVPSSQSADMQALDVILFTYGCFFSLNALQASSAAT